MAYAEFRKRSDFRNLELPRPPSRSQACKRATHFRCISIALGVVLVSISICPHVGLVRVLAFVLRDFVVFSVRQQNLHWHLHARSIMPITREIMLRDAAHVMVGHHAPAVLHVRQSLFVISRQHTISRIIRRYSSKLLSYEKPRTNGLLTTR